MSTSNELKSMADFNKKRKKQTSLSTFFADPAKGIEHFNHIMGNDCNDCESSENVSTDVSTNVGGGLMEEKKKINIKEALNNIDKETMNTDLLSMYESCVLSLKEKQDIVNLILKEDIKGLDSYLLKKLNEEDEGDYFNGEDTNSDLDNNDTDSVQCAWCGEYFEPTELHREKDLGYLCDRCVSGIKSRGETFDFEDSVDPRRYSGNIKDELGGDDYNYELVFDGEKENNK